jgi:hypothetical protein
LGRVAHVDYLLVGLLGGVRPDKLEPSFGKCKDGTYARFYFSWPSEAEYQPLNDCADAVNIVLYNILAKIIDLPAGDEGIFAPRKIALSESAMEEFQRYRKFMFATRKRLEDFGRGARRCRPQRRATCHRHRFEPRGVGGGRVSGVGKISPLDAGAF